MQSKVSSRAGACVRRVIKRVLAYAALAAPFEYEKDILGCFLAVSTPLYSRIASSTTRVRVPSHKQNDEYGVLPVQESVTLAMGLPTLT